MGVPRIISPKSLNSKTSSKTVPFKVRSRPGNVLQFAFLYIESHLILLTPDVKVIKITEILCDRVDTVSV